ncbi:MAG: methyltransferase domain-containing protein [Verrucomicrobia bacterium]|nr:methyltransferase domain-containing protein [Verrucomicrobiota bacterium]
MPNVNGVSQSEGRCQTLQMTLCEESCLHLGDSSLLQLKNELLPERRNVHPAPNPLRKNSSWNFHGIKRMNNYCRGCSAPIVELLNLGLQPPSNRFLSSPAEPCDEHPMQFGYCPVCSFGQLLNPRPAQSIISRHSWLSYNEPEGHLDQLVASLSAATTTGAAASILGITYKDDSTLARFNRLGFAHCRRLDQALDLGIEDPLASLESIQEALTSARADQLTLSYKKADILIVRHLLEHAHNPLALLHACMELVKSGGLMAFEVPDCRKMLNGGDHCFLWEEHITYFTPTTLKGFFELAGLSEIDVKIYPYAMEDSLVAVVKNSSQPNSKLIKSLDEIQRLETFKNSFSVRRERIRAHLSELHSQGKKIAVFGAGHLTLKFINYYGLAPFIEYVVDDNPHKQGLFMPGSQLPIKASNYLEVDKIDLCLLGLNPESEQKVRQSKARYVELGGRFLSIFSASGNNIDGDL